MYLMLYKGITGKEYHSGKFGLHDFRRWGVDNVSTIEHFERQGITPHAHYWIYRDPIERYISAFHSKLKCCFNSTETCFKE